MKKKPVIAIDGPAGAGKSTLAKLLAKRLGIYHLDTGAMYRAIALKALQTNTPLDDAVALVRLAAETNLFWEGDRLLMDGRDVSEMIRDPKVSGTVSLVARVPGVRTRLVEIQRRIAGEGGIVMDGRDIGTVVLPNADYKFFLTASLEERARRRHAELATKNLSQSMEEVKATMEWRDQVDSQREVAPLTAAKDAILLDTTGLSIEEVLEKMLAVILKEVVS